MEDKQELYLATLLQVKVTEHGSMSGLLLDLWCAFYARLALHVTTHCHCNNDIQSPYGDAFFTLLGKNITAKHSLELLPHLENISSLPSAWQIQELLPFQYLVLLPEESLHRISLLCALLIHKSRVAKTIQKDQLRSLHTLVGQEAWFFALRRAVNHENEGLAPCFQLQDKGVPITTLIKYTAACIVGFCLQNTPSSLQKHVTFMLPQSLYAECPFLSEEQSVILQNLLLQVTHDKVEPSWKNII